MLGGAPYAAAGAKGRALAVGCGTTFFDGAGLVSGSVLGCAATGSLAAEADGAGLGAGAGSATENAGGAAEWTSSGAAAGAP
jgi:hypothetical protein